MTSSIAFALFMAFFLGFLIPSNPVNAQACTPDSAAIECDIPSLIATGDALYAESRYREAVGLFRRALGLAEMLAANGGDPLDLATVLVRLGAAMFHDTHSTAAQPILARALAIRTDILGDHADTAEVLDLMSLVRFGNAEAVSAEGLMGDAARMRARLAE